MTRILGLSKLQRKLQRMPEVAKARIKEAMEQGANEIVDMMKSFVPVDSGDLRDSIGWTWGKAPKGAMTVGTVKSTTGNLVLTIYAGGGDAWYARLVEFGTRAHENGGQFPGTQHPGTSKQPFFYTSFRALRKRTKSRITRAMNKAAKEVAAGK